MAVFCRRVESINDIFQVSRRDGSKIQLEVKKTITMARRVKCPFMER